MNEREKEETKNILRIKERTRETEVETDNEKETKKNEMPF